MGGDINIPNLEQNPIDIKDNKIRYGINKIQGRKKSLDVFNFNKTINISQDEVINILGIFDGHSGNEIAQYLSENFCNELSKNANSSKMNKNSYNMVIDRVYKKINR